jgi:hypothetical protein
MAGANLNTSQVFTSAFEDLLPQSRAFANVDVYCGEHTTVAADGALAAEVSVAGFICKDNPSGVSLHSNCK